MGWTLSAEHIGSRLEEVKFRMNKEVDFQREATETLWGSTWVDINRL